MHTPSCSPPLPLPDLGLRDELSIRATHVLGLTLPPTLSHDRQSSTIRQPPGRQAQNRNRSSRPLVGRHTGSLAHAVQWAAHYTHPLLNMAPPQELIHPSEHDSNIQKKLEKRWYTEQGWPPEHTPLPEHKSQRTRGPRGKRRAVRAEKGEHCPHMQSLIAIT